MTNVIDLFGKGLHQFGLRVHQVAPDQWDAPTPCEDWTVRELVYHVINEQRWAPPLLAGKGLEESGDLVSAIVNRDPVADWDEASGLAYAAFAAPGTFEREVALSRGSTPVGDYLNEMILDASVHAWDLGKGIGLVADESGDLVAYVYGMVTAYGDLTATGAFAAPMPIGDGASAQDRLIALVGRNPNWSATR